MRFRPCIDLHEGKVKQIVGSTLDSVHPGSAEVNFESGRSAAFYADLYWRHGLSGGHVILLGPGNQAAARQALGRHPGLLQVGGGITPENASGWLDAGASHVIVTSFLFEDGRFSFERLRRLRDTVGREHLVVDLSCRRRGERYVVACDRWQTLTQLELGADVLAELAEYCEEFLIHAVDVEGRQRGVEELLIEQLGVWVDIPTTYAGGIRAEADIETIERLGASKLDFTVGSALDIFGGHGLSFAELVRRYAPPKG